MTSGRHYLKQSCDGRSDMVILRPNRQNRMVTKDYRKGVYNWVWARVPRAPSPAKCQHHRVPFAGPICSVCGTGTTIACRPITSSYPARTSAADRSHENFFTCSYPRSRIFSRNA